MRSKPFDLKSAFIALAALLTPFAAGAQQPTVSPFVQRALSRDTTLTIWLFVRPDRPVAAVADAVTAAGGRVRRVSDWLHALSADVSTGTIGTLRRRTDLRHIQPVARFLRRPDPRVEAAQAFVPAPAEPAADDFGQSLMPFRVMNLLPLANRNFRGQNVKIAILDTGFETGLPLFATTSVIGQRDFVNNDSVVRSQAGECQNFHGTATWSLLGGNQQGALIGVAPGAQYILARTEDACREVRLEEDNYVAALQWADSLGAKIVSSSLGYFDFDSGFTYTKAQLNGDVAVTTIAVDIAAQKGITVVTSAGNDGPGTQTLGTPADADSAIAVGAVDSLGGLASFSSRGPTADGRTKPDVTAPGVRVWVAGSTANSFGRADGTSFSAPLTAGAAALLKQIHPTFGPIDIRDALRAAGNNTQAPDNNRGWGTPDVAVAATFPRGIVVQSPLDPVLTTTTPSFSWATPGVPAFALPATYRLTVAGDAGFTTTPFLDTTLTGTSVTMPRPIRFGATVYFRIVATGADSASLTSTSGPLTVPSDPTLPTMTLLFQNFPNPFPDRSTGRRSTCLWFDLATTGRVQLDIVDIRGHVVRHLVPGPAFPTVLPAGHYGRLGADCDPALEWDGTESNGTFVPQGIYLVKLVTPDGTSFKRIVFLGPDI